LISNVLIRGDKKLKTFFGEAEQLSICNAAPATLLRCFAFVFNEQHVDGPGDALVQKNSHTVGDSKADSDRSKTRQAITRVTDGKHSRNSSSE
jgi:hypothetical protein